MLPANFVESSNKISEYLENYYKKLSDLPVRSQVKPGAILEKLPKSSPDSGDTIDNIMKDFDSIVMPGITHWQHPSFFAYFPSNASPYSILAEQLISGIAAQCMLWQTSPAATEMEIRICDWLRQELGLPEDFKGTIQDSASTATLCAIVTMREVGLKKSEKNIGLEKLKIYASEYCHSSIEKAAKIAGLGNDNLTYISTSGENEGSEYEKLIQHIKADKAKGLVPIGIVGVVGATSFGATDNIRKLCEVSRKYGLYLHVDAAWAGSAMICPEFRSLWDGIDQADSLVFNPHKWLGANFDCSIQFLKNPNKQIDAISIVPEYLRTMEHNEEEIIDFSNWTVQLGRKFRALKLWFLIRGHGMKFLREMIRNHINWAEEVYLHMQNDAIFEIVTPRFLSLFLFRFKNVSNLGNDEFNTRILSNINNDGRLYFTQTKYKGALSIRFQIGSFYTDKKTCLESVKTMKEIYKTKAILKGCAAP